MIIVKGALDHIKEIYRNPAIFIIGRKTARLGSDVLRLERRSQCIGGHLARERVWGWTILLHRQRRRGRSAWQSWQPSGWYTSPNPQMMKEAGYKSSILIYAWGWRWWSNELKSLRVKLNTLAEADYVMTFPIKIFSISPLGSFCKWEIVRTIWTKLVCCSSMRHLENSFNTL